MVDNEHSRSLDTHKLALNKFFFLITATYQADNVSRLIRGL